MPAVPAKQYKRRNRRNRKGRKPLSKSQAKAVKSIALSQINGTRELKSLYTKIDEVAIPLQTGTQFLQDTNGNMAFNIMPNGDSSYQREGLEITQKYFSFQGHCKINGGSALSQNREIVCRVIWGFTKGPLAASSTQLMMNANFPVAIPSDFSAIYKPLNWNIFRPFKDQRFKLAPAHQYVDGVGDYVNILNPVPDCKLLTASYSFGKKGKSMKFPDNSLSYANKDNIVCLVICRNANDDLSSSVLNLEFCGTTNFRYQDA